MGGNGGRPLKYGDPVQFRLQQEPTHEGPRIVPGINIEELKYQMPPEGPDGMAYTRVEPSVQYRPVQEWHAYKERPHMPPTHAHLLPDGSLPEH
jgi:hypothetical protein